MVTLWSLNKSIYFWSALPQTNNGVFLFFQIVENIIPITVPIPKYSNIPERYKKYVTYYYFIIVHFIIVK